MRREQGHGMLHCGSKIPGAKKKNTFSHILYENEEIATYLRAN